MSDPRNFALVGAAGFVAPRHLQAIRDTGNELVAALDPSDSVGVLDNYFPDVRFFTEFERFDRHLEKLRRRGESDRAHYLSVCSPNYLHDAHIRLALRLGADAICEKPLVVNPWNLDQLAELEREFGRRVWTVMQLRLHPTLIALRERLRATDAVHDVVLTYITRRGPWYDVSWKGSADKSGGLAMNLGVHFFDLLAWLFGSFTASAVHLHEPRRMSGALRFERARVRWYLSVERAELPEAAVAQGRTAWRELTIDGEAVEFSGGFTDLHTRAYAGILAGQGLGIEDARPAIELVHRVRHADVEAPADDAHPLLPGHGAGSAR